MYKGIIASQCQGCPCSLPNWSVMSTQRTCRSTPKSLGHVNAIFIQTEISPETLLWKTPRNQFVLSIYLRSRDPKSFSSFQVGLNLSQLRFGQSGYNLLLSDIPRQIKIQLGIGCISFRGTDLVGTLERFQTRTIFRVIAKSSKSSPVLDVFDNSSASGFLETENRISLNSGLGISVKSTNGWQPILGRRESCEKRVRALFGCSFKLLFTKRP